MYKYTLYNIHTIMLSVLGNTKHKVYQQLNCSDTLRNYTYVYVHFGCGSKRE